MAPMKILRGSTSQANKHYCSAELVTPTGIKCLDCSKAFRTMTGAQRHMYLQHGYILTKKPRTRNKLPGDTHLDNTLDNVVSLSSAQSLPTGMCTSTNSNNGDGELFSSAQSLPIGMFTNTNDVNFELSSNVQSLPLGMSTNTDDDNVELLSRVQSFPVGMPMNINDVNVEWSSRAQSLPLGMSENTDDFNVELLTDEQSLPVRMSSNINAMQMLEQDNTLKLNKSNDRLCENATNVSSMEQPVKEENNGIRITKGDESLSDEIQIVFDKFDLNHVLMKKNRILEETENALRNVEAERDELKQEVEALRLNDSKPLVRSPVIETRIFEQMRFYEGEIEKRDQHILYMDQQVKDLEAEISTLKELPNDPNDAKFGKVRESPSEDKVLMSEESSFVKKTDDNDSKPLIATPIIERRICEQMRFYEGEIEKRDQHILYMDQKVNAMEAENSALKEMTHDPDFEKFRKIRELRRETKRLKDEELSIRNQIKELQELLDANHSETVSMDLEIRRLVSALLK